MGKYDALFGSDVGSPEQSKYAALFESDAGQAQGKYSALFEPPTAGELSTLQAPEGSPQREEINRAVAGNLMEPPGKFARTPTVSEAVQAALPQPPEGETPLARPLPEAGPYEQGGILGAIMPPAEAVGNLVGGIPGFVGQLPGMAYQGTKYAVGGPQERAQVIAELLKQSVPQGKQIASGLQSQPGSPEWWNAAVQAGVLATPGLELAREFKPIIPEAPPIQPEAFQLRPSPTLGPGTTAEAVSQALEGPGWERRFTTVPEAPTTLAPTEPLSETIQSLQVPEGAPPAAPPTTADLVRSILDRRAELMPEAQQLAAQADLSRQMGLPVHPAIESRLVEINQELNQPTIGQPEVPQEILSPAGTLPAETANIADLIRSRAEPPVAEAIRAQAETPAAQPESFAGMAATEFGPRPIPDTGGRSYQITHGNSNAVVNVDPDAIQLQSINTPLAERGQGTASALIENLKRESDASGRPIIGSLGPEVSPEFWMQRGFTVDPSGQIRYDPRVAAVPEIPPEDLPYAGVEASPQAVSDQPHVSAIANDFVAARAARGEIGEIAPGQGFATNDLVARGLRMPPERAAEAVSRMMQGGDVPIDDAAAIRGEEARLSQRSNELSRAAQANPADVNAQLAADNAFKDLTDFHNGPIAQLKRNWHAQGMGMQGEIPVDLSTLNGLREAWLKDTGAPPPPEAEPILRRTADKVARSVAEEKASGARLGEEIEKTTRGRKLPTPEEVRNNITERMKVEPCIT